MLFVFTVEGILKGEVSDGTLLKEQWSAVRGLTVTCTGLTSIQDKKRIGQNKNKTVQAVIQPVLYWEVPDGGVA